MRKREHLPIQTQTDNWGLAFYRVFWGLFFMALVGLLSNVYEKELDEFISGVGRLKYGGGTGTGKSLTIEEIHDPLPIYMHG